MPQGPSRSDPTDTVREREKVEEEEGEIGLTETDGLECAVIAQGSG